MGNFFKISEDQNRSYGIDLLRAMAIILVLLYHFPRNDHEQVVKAICYFGWAGVDLFFALSGFLIASSVFETIVNRNNFEVRAFYIKRIFRTLPSYYIVLFLEYYLYRPQGSIANYLIFLQGYNKFTFFSVSWSLCIEEHFYFFFPLIIYFISKSKNIFKNILIVFLSISIITILARIYNYYSINYIQFIKTNPGLARELYLYNLCWPTHVHLEGLCFGIIIAGIKYFRVQLWQKIMLSKNKLLFLFIILISMSFLINFKRVEFFGAIFGFTIFALSFSFLIMMSYQYKLKKSIIIESIALISYSMYLTHLLATSFFFYLFGNLESMSLLLRISILFPLQFLFAYIFYILIERPSTNARKYFLKKNT